MPIILGNTQEPPKSTTNPLLTKTSINLVSGVAIIKSLKSIMFAPAPAAIPSTSEIIGFLQFHIFTAAFETSSISALTVSPN